MTKTTVTRLFIGGALAVVAGAVLAIAAVWIAIANHVFVMNGPDVVGFTSSAFTWPMLGLAAVGGLTVMAGLISGLVSWIGALLNTSQLENKTWFLVLLILGIFSFGVIAMLAYVVAGPDGSGATGARNGQPAAGATTA
jgi:hypothetical protein